MGCRALTHTITSDLISLSVCLSLQAGAGEKKEHLYKILVIGELGTGKTSIIKRYVHQFFSQHYRATVSAMVGAWRTVYVVYVLCRAFYVARCVCCVASSVLCVLYRALRAVRFEPRLRAVCFFFAARYVLCVLCRALCIVRFVAHCVLCVLCRAFCVVRFVSRVVYCAFCVVRL